MCVCVRTIHLESIFVGSMYTLRLTTLHVCNNNLQRKKEYQLESWGYGRGLRERLWKGLEREKKGGIVIQFYFNQKDIGILMSKY